MRADFLRAAPALLLAFTFLTSPATARATASEPADGAPATGIASSGPLHQPGSAVSPPTVLHSVPPRYSEEARLAKFNGSVVIGLIVDAQGLPQNVHVLHGAGMGLDEKAVEAVKQYTFNPATLQGRPVPVAINIEVDFQIFKGPPPPNTNRQQAAQTHTPH